MRCFITDCPACHSNDLELLIDMGDQPMSLVALQKDPHHSKVQKCHPIKMLICRNCAHVFNSEYSSENVRYTDTGCRMFNAGSGWQDHIDVVYGLLLPIVKDETLDLIIEIGAGDCEFLAGLDTTAGRIAVDPCEAVLSAAKHGFTFYREHFDPVKHIPRDSGNILLIMRHLLEHLERPRDILEDIARAAKARPHSTILYLEVPSCENALRNCRIEDWTYEHPQHFTINSMRALLRASGFDHFIVMPKYDREVLSVIVKIEPVATHDTDLCVDTVLMDYERVEQNIRRGIGWMRHHAHCTVFWGGAGKSAMFIRKFHLPEDDTTVVDSHEEKWGMCVPGTGIKIEPPSILRDVRPDYVIATTSWRANDIRDEIVRDDIPCRSLFKFEGGDLTEVPLGR
jgi:hypothetical protein